MSLFMTGVADLVREECRTTMLHGDMILSRLMVYAQSIEDSELRRMDRSLKRGGSSDQVQPRFKKRAQTQYGPSPKVKIEKGGGSLGEDRERRSFKKWQAYMCHLWKETLW